MQLKKIAYALKIDFAIFQAIPLSNWSLSIKVDKKNI